MDRPGSSDCQCTDRYARRHLSDGEEGVHALECFGLYRYAQNREARFSRHHPRQMRGTTGASDDDLQSPIQCGLCVFEQEVRCAMRRDDSGFVCDAEFFQQLTCMTHRVPIGL